MTDQAPTTPDTVVVPVEPTREMWAAGADAVIGYKQRHHDKVVEQIWTAMLAAHPAATPGGEREAIARAIDPQAWDDDLFAEPGGSGQKWRQEAALKAADRVAALSRLAPVAGEAVAWLIEWTDEAGGEAQTCRRVQMCAKPDAWMTAPRVTPLYATPEPAAARGGERPLCVIAFREGKREPELISWDRMPAGEYRLYSGAQNLGFLVDTDDGTEWVEDDPRISGVPEYFENLRRLTLEVAHAEMLAAWEANSESALSAKGGS